MAAQGCSGCVCCGRTVLFSWWVGRGSEDASPMESLLLSPSFPPSLFVVLLPTRPGCAAQCQEGCSSPCHRSVIFPF